jgi:thioredoxin-related protein
VDRLARQLQGQAELIRVNVATPTGLAVAQLYNVFATPTLLVFDGQGNVVYTHVGIPNAGAVAKVVEELQSE